MKNFKRVEILFEDHYSLGDDWFELDENEKPRLLSAIGFLVKEDEKYYYLASTYDLGIEKYQAGTAVLKSCVVDFHEYEQTQKDPDSKRRKSRRS